MRVFIIALAAVAVVGGCRDERSTVVVRVSAEPRVAGVVQLRAMFSNARAGDTRLFPMERGTTPIMFDTAFSVTLPTARQGAVDIALSGLDREEKEIAHGANRVVLVKGGVATVDITLKEGPSPCGNGLSNTGEECDDGNRLSGDGCSYICEREPGNTPIADASGTTIADAGVDRPAADAAGPGEDVRPADVVPPDVRPVDGSEPPRALGAACTVGSQCQSTHCVGGRCCDKACTDPCSSCATGTCASSCAAGQTCYAGTCDGKEIVDVAAGSHACALTKAGRLFCWGANQYGQLGAPRAMNVSCSRENWPCRYEAVEVPGLTDVVDVSVGLDFTCAVRRGGAVVCWGRNDFGQLGHDPAQDASCGEPCSERPIEVKGLTNAAGVSAGRWHACAWTSDGAAHCWGRNNEGTLGRGNLSVGDHNPAVVTGLRSGVQKVVLQMGGTNHVCALLADKRVTCWGRNSHGQLGHTPGTLGDVQCMGDHCNGTPVAVAGLGMVKDLFLADSVSCVVLDDQTVSCWGYDGSGLRPGFPGTSATARPVVVPPSLGGSGWRGHLCVRTSLSDVQCWGQNYYGQLGDGTFMGMAHPCECKGPQQVGSLKVKALAAGNDFTVAALFDGTVWAWGSNVAAAVGHQPGTLGDLACRDMRLCTPRPTQVRGLP